MYSLLKRIFFIFDPETAHLFVKTLSPFLPKKLLSKKTRQIYPVLKTSLGGISLDNPIGLAAGFDKNGEMLALIDALGFGFAEIGSITFHPCVGNKKPRIFRYPKEESLVNRLGLPNLGARVIADKLKKDSSGFSYGINIAKTPDFAFPKGFSKNGISDFLSTYENLKDLGFYSVLNLSCPNTEDGRTFEDPILFAELAEAFFKKKSKKPHLVKLSPSLPLEQLKKLCESALKLGFDGFVVSNTMPTSEGGVSGKKLLVQANAQLKKVFEITKGQALLIGVGGILSFEDLLTKLALGAEFFQIYTGLIYRGPFFVAHLNNQLANFCKKTGVKNYRELVGNPEILLIK